MTARKSIFSVKKHMCLSVLYEGCGPWLGDRSHSQVFVSHEEQVFFIYLFFMVVWPSGLSQVVFLQSRCCHSVTCKGHCLVLGSGLRRLVYKGVHGECSRMF